MIESKRVKIGLWLILVMLIFSYQLKGQSNVKSQPRNFYFDHLTVRDGLSQSTVLSIHQDKMGFMWVGTRDGLNRYDGYDFLSYKYDPGNTNSLPGNVVTTISESPDGELWIGTDKGLCKLDRNTGHFFHFEFDDSQGEDTEIRDILISQTGVVWVATPSGVCLKYPDELVFKRYYYSDELVKNKFSHSTSSLFQSRDGSVLVGTVRHGLFCFKEDDLIFHITPELLKINDNPSIRIESLLEQDSTFWIATYGNGVFQINQHGVVIRNITSSQVEGLTDDNVRALEIDNDGYIWIGTFQGLNILDPKKGTIDHIHFEYGEIKGLSHGSIRSLFKDNKGAVWVGTYFGGINIFDQDNQRFRYVYHQPGRYNSLSYNVVGAFEQLPSGEMAIGTERGGLNIADREGTHHKVYQSDESDIAALSSNTIKSLFSGENGKLWIGAFRGGLNSFDFHSKEFRRFPKSNHPDYQKLSSLIINDITTDGRGNLWIATDSDGGLFKFNLKGERFENYDFQDTLRMIIGSSPVRSIFIDGLGNNWLATYDKGIIIFNEGTGIIANFRDISQNKNLGVEEINHLFEDDKGLIWAATKGSGVYIYDRVNQKFNEFEFNSQLPNQNIFGILQDDESRIWFVHTKGISLWDIQGKQIKSYTFGSGFPLEEVNEGAYFKSKEGRFFIGGSNGYTIFDPLEIRDNTFIPPTFITGLRVSNQRVNPGDDFGILNDNISNTTEITLSYFQSVVTFEFSALSFHKPENNQYAYILEGFDKDWNYIASKRNVTYTNLPDGKYILKVKASNNDGIWNENPAELEIRVLPPPWKTWWAYLIYVGLLLGGIFLIRNNAMKTAQLKHEVKIEQIEKTKLKELHQLKLEYFTDVSHEFRTPLTLVINPLEEIVESKEGSPWLRKRIKSIYYNCRRLLLLVDQILEIRALETGHSKLYSSAIRVDEFFLNLTDSFKYLADKKKVKLQLKATTYKGLISIDQDKLEKILYNLISNAFKFTQTGGTVTVRFRIKEVNNGNWLMISVEDTGVGIEPEDVDHIFDRFYKKGHKNTGSGIGLSLTRSLIEKLGGQIKVKSSKENGTKFSLRIPFNSVLEDSKNNPSQPLTRSTPLEYFPSDIFQPKQEYIDTKDKKLIVLAEDNNDLRRYLKEHLGKMYNVMGARNGKKALQKTRKEGPDLVISDIIMPELDGLDLCKIIKSDPDLCHIPVILLTAKGAEIDKITGLEVGADEYLAKPFSWKELDLRIKNILKSREMLQARISNAPSLAEIEIPLNSFDNKLLRRINDLIKDHLSEPNLTVEFLGDEVGMSRVNLYRKLKALTGKSPGELIKSLKLERAAEMLKTGEYRVSDAAYATGFQDVHYFSKCFKKKFKKNPTSYKIEYAENSKS